MNDLTLVTIGIPLYNEEEYILETILSAINQTFRDVEIIISDNGSTDQSLEIVNKIAAQDKRIIVISHDYNKGPWNNFQCLLDAAKGKYFIWLGSHDVMVEDYVEDAVTKMEKDNTIVAVYPKVYSITDGVIGSEFVNPEYESGSVSNRFISIIRNTKRGSAIHSIYRTDILRKSFKEINGGDLLTLLSAASYGNMVPTDNLSLYMRVVRSGEKSDEIKTRYASYGFKENWEQIRYMYPFEVCSNLKDMRVKDKLIFLPNILDAMKAYGGYWHWKEIFYYHLKSHKYKTAFYTFLCWFKYKLKK